MLRDLLSRNQSIAPHHMPAEASNILRRIQLRGEISASVASLAHLDLQALSVGLVPYHSFALRSSELRQNLSIYDAAYVALAEGLGLPLATLDMKMVRAPGPCCEFLVPPGP